MMKQDLLIVVPPTPHGAKTSDTVFAPMAACRDNASGFPHGLKLIFPKCPCVVMGPVLPFPPGVFGDYLGPRQF